MKKILTLFVWIVILTSCEKPQEQIAETIHPQRYLYGIWELENAHQNIYIDNKLQEEQFEAIFYQKPILRINADGTFVDSGHAIPGLWKFSEAKRQLFFDINEGEQGFVADYHIDELTETSLTYSSVKETTEMYKGEKHTVRTEKVMHFIKPHSEL